MYSYARNISRWYISGRNPLPVIYELDRPGGHGRILKHGEKANPGLGTIKKLDDLINKVERAKDSPKDLSGILTKDFNIRDTISTVHGLQL